MGEEKKQSLYISIGGKETLQRVHKVFYDLVYKDFWIGQFFADIPQKTIEDQQTDFMTTAMGGPEIYQGKFPIPAHKHMFITEDLFDLRQSLLKQAIAQAKVPQEFADKWLKIDGAFRKGIVKESIYVCEKRYTTDTILSFPNPAKKVA